MERAWPRAPSAAAIRLCGTSSCRRTTAATPSSRRLSSPTTIASGRGLVDGGRQAARHPHPRGGVQGGRPKSAARRDDQLCRRLRRRPVAGRGVVVGARTDGGLDDRRRGVLDLRAGGPQQGKFELVLEGTALVTPKHPELAVEVMTLGKRLAEVTFRFPKARNRIQARLPATASDERGRTVVRLRVRHPARPVDLGLSGDSRLLGLHLHSLFVRRSSWAGNLLFSAGSIVAKFRRRLTGSQSS